jgi:hypothetical protein
MGFKRAMLESGIDILILTMIFNGLTSTKEFP